MRYDPRRDAGSGRGIGRRTWLAGVALSCVGVSTRADGMGRQEGEGRQREEVEALGKQAGLRPFRMGRSGHYLAIGDSRDDFRSLTLRDCEAIAADFQDHYRAKGFKVRRPEGRLTVVTLADDRSFEKFLGVKGLSFKPSKHPEPAIHGTYDPEANRLIIFDHRSLGPQLAPRAGHSNLRTLAHEATHQLTFNTGLLDRQGDAPACIVEGLAMYGEVRRLTGRTAPGQLNLMRLEDLARVQRRKVPWIPVADLLAEDRCLRGQVGGYERLLAYAESWLLVDYLMKEPSGLAVIHKYLETIRGRIAPETRLEDARASLGDLDLLNRNIRRYSAQLLKSDAFTLPNRTSIAGGISKRE